MNNRYNNGCCPNTPCDYPRPGNIYLEVSIASDKGIKMDDMYFILKFYVYGNSEFRYINKNQMATSEGKYYAVLHEDELMTGWLFCDVEILESVEEWPKVKKPVTARVNTGILLGGCRESHPANPNVGQCGGEGYKITVTRVKEIPYIPEEGEQDKHECCLTSEECWAEYFGLPELIADRAVADEKGNRIVDTYVTRFAAAQYIRSVFNDMFTNNPPMILEGYITPEMLSDAVINLLKANGTSVTNLPDGEDITTIHGVLKLSNKQYNAGAYSGLGRQYLRKNLVGGQNLLVQSMMQWSNTIYIIQYDYDLNGETLNIPKGCTLDFQGGSISNGTLILNNTSVPRNIVIEDYVLAKIEGTYKAGQCLYSIEKKKIICWDGEKWTDANGHEIMDSVGDSGSRPDFQFETNVGFQFYDTTLNKPIWWNGLAWVDSNGDEV